MATSKAGNTPEYFTFVSARIMIDCIQLFKAGTAVIDSYYVDDRELHEGSDGESKGTG